MSKQITRWVGKEKDYCSFWDIKKPKPSFNGHCYYAPRIIGEGHLYDISLSVAKNIVPALKKMKVGELRKIRIIVEDKMKG